MFKRRQHETAGSPTHFDDVLEVPVWDPFQGPPPQTAAPSGEEPRSAAPRIERGFGTPVPVDLPTGGGWESVQAAQVEAERSRHQREVLSAQAFVLRVACTSVWPTDDEGRKSLIRKARRQAHPDLHQGRRDDWDALESALVRAGLQKDL